MKLKTIFKAPEIPKGRMVLTIIGAITLATGSLSLLKYTSLKTQSTLLKQKEWILTNSALKSNTTQLMHAMEVAAYSGQLFWETKYSDAFQKLQQTLEKLKVEFLKSEEDALIDEFKTLLSNQDLLAQKVFTLVRKLNTKSATETIESIELELNETQLAEATEKLIAIGDIEVKNNEREIIKLNQLSQGLILFIFISFFVCLGFILKILLKWNQQAKFATETFDLEIHAKSEELKEQYHHILISSKMSVLGEMAGGIAHEINNPLSVILGAISLLSRKLERNNKIDSPTREEIQITLNKLTSMSIRISRIVKGLKTFSRSGEGDPYLEFNLRDSLESTISLCAERLKKADVELKLKGSFDFRIEARETQISQIIMNLVQNACDAISGLDTRWIEIDCENDKNQQVKITVTDSGNGIPPAIAEKLMQPFFTTKEVGKGTGLGLSISKGIIEDHGGKLYLDQSHPHTRFVIELPLRQMNTVHGSKSAA